LPVRDRHGVSRVDPGAGPNLQDEGAADDLREDRGKRQQARERLLLKCGSPLYSTAPGDGPKDSYMLRVGILRQRDQLTPRRQIWFRSARPWITRLADLPKDETQTGTAHLR